jgi:LmbE family N-acetylglucosaminyl deacetylase
MHIVVVVPHPDEETLRFGGTIAKYVKAGHKATIIVLTKGGLGHARMSSEELKQARTEEATKAAGILGADIIVMDDFEDRAVPTDPYALGEVLVDPLRALRPDIVLCNDPTRLPIRDQSNAALGVLSAVELLYLPLLEAKNPPAPTPDVYYLAESQKPDVFIDITDVMDTRIAAMRCYKTQIEGAWELYWGPRSPDQIPDARTAEETWIQRELKTEAWWGKQSGVEYAEAYVAFKSPMKKARSAFPTAE